MLNSKQLRTLLNIALKKPVLIIIPDGPSAIEARRDIYKAVWELIPRFVCSYTQVYNGLCFKGHEKITITTADEWNRERKFSYNGIVLLWDGLTELPEKLLYTEKEPQPISQFLAVASENDINMPALIKHRIGDISFEQYRSDRFRVRSEHGEIIDTGNGAEAKRAYLDEIDRKYDHKLSLMLEAQGINPLL